jgi:hypothetical protein
VRSRTEFLSKIWVENPVLLGLLYATKVKKSGEGIATIRLGTWRESKSTRVASPCEKSRIAAGAIGR